VNNFVSFLSLPTLFVLVWFNDHEMTFYFKTVYISPFLGEEKKKVKNNTKMRQVSLARCLFLKK